MARQPRVVGRAGQPDDGRARPPGQLHGDRADPARGARHDDHSPGPAAAARTAAYALVPATYSDPATAHGTPAGFGTRLASGTTVASAWLAASVVYPSTWSPGTSRAPAPAALTMPARSWPCPDGNAGGNRPANMPPRMLASPGFTAAAMTATVTSPGPGSGTSCSTTRSTSTSP